MPLRFEGSRINNLILNKEKENDMKSKFPQTKVSTESEVLALNKIKSQSFNFYSGNAELKNSVFTDGVTEIFLNDCESLTISDCIFVSGLKIFGDVKKLILNNVNGVILNSCFHCDEIIVSKDEFKDDTSIKLKRTKVEGLKILELQPGTSFTYSNPIEDLQTEKLIVNNYAKFSVCGSYVRTKMLVLKDDSVVCFSNELELENEFEDLKAKFEHPNCRIITHDAEISKSTAFYFSQRGFKVNNMEVSIHSMNDDIDSTLIHFSTKSGMKSVCTFFKEQ